MPSCQACFFCIVSSNPNTPRPWPRVLDSSVRMQNLEASYWSKTQCFEKSFLPQKAAWLCNDLLVAGWKGQGTGSVWETKLRVQVAEVPRITARGRNLAHLDYTPIHWNASSSVLSLALLVNLVSCKSKVVTVSNDFLIPIKHCKLTSATCIGPIGNGMTSVYAPNCLPCAK